MIMKWALGVIAFVVFLCILRNGKDKPKGQVGRIAKEGCFNVDVMDDEHFGDPIPCDDGEPESTMDYTEPLAAGGMTNAPGPSFNPTGVSVFVTYDKT